MATYLDEGVVQDEHDGRGPPCPLLSPKQHLANVADIAHLGMPQAELPQDNRATPFSQSQFCALCTPWKAG